MIECEEKRKRVRSLGTDEGVAHINIRVFPKEHYERMIAGVVRDTADIRRIAGDF